MVLSDEIKNNVSENSEKISAKDFKFFNVAFLERLAVITEKEACNCSECKANMDTLLFLSEHYPQMMEAGKEGKKDLETAADFVSDHLIEEHGYSKKDWFKPLYALYGFLAGIVLGAAGVVFSDGDSDYKKKLFLILFSVAVAAGYVFGAIKDKKQRENLKII
ncbi:MAG: hypothetical protein IIU03_05125 [Bacteroidales bacterium]|nr:hypothetical protein [Bacteroidales bacterium]MBQ5539607.1 hypothetical protein [Bacteroidales bacterium]MBR4677890.1 hypothetical protein [Bacteroidales bacterium]